MPAEFLEGILHASAGYPHQALAVRPDRRAAQPVIEDP